MLNKRELKVHEEAIPVEVYADRIGSEAILSIVARAQEATGIPDTSGMVQSFLNLMLEVAQAGVAYFLQLDAATNELFITHVRGDPESQYLIGLRLNCQQDLPGLSLYETRVAMIGDLTSDPDWLRAINPATSIEKKNVISVPVTHLGKILGLIQIFNYQHTELDLLLILVNQLGVELERRETFGQLQQSNDRLLTLVDMLGEIAGTLDRNTLLHMVTENAAHLVNAERSTLFLVNPNTSETIYQVAYQPPMKNSKHTAAQPAARLAKKESRSSTLQEEKLSHFNRSAITVPLRSGAHRNEEGQNDSYVLGGLMVLDNTRASFQEEDARLMRILANQTSTFLQVAEMYETTEELFLGAIKSLITAIEAKDSYTEGHSQRVSDYSVVIAKELGFDESQVNDIRIGSLLHDIGKIGIPDSILLKKGRLSPEEMETMRGHPQTGVNILSQVKLLNPMRPAILEHHERLDGSGYPAKLSDQQISWMGRIVAVADVYDAMTSTRPYRQALSSQEVLAYLNEQVGILFDEPCVQALKSALLRVDPLN